MSNKERMRFRQFSLQVIRNNDIIKERLMYLENNTPDEIGKSMDDIIIERELLQNLLLKRKRMYDHLVWYYTCLYKNKF